ncbi:hypothetical protein [Pandoravirus japonicus]|uniref:Uncharacterized protein n=1 Tax=Pandoravirus japonicus TaxID=2823154 RepID=A0A811BRT1_9VIRU|nr:hypothetical protein [Pandoravirus japonicus]
MGPPLDRLRCLVFFFFFPLTGALGRVLPWPLLLLVFSPACFGCGLLFFFSALWIESQSQAPFWPHRRSRENCKSDDLPKRPVQNKRK